MLRHCLFVLLIVSFAAPCRGQRNPYPWLQGTPERTIVSQITPPSGFQRTQEAEGSFAHWLRRLPLKKKGSPVLLHTGKPRANQTAHVAVLDIDTGTRNLQQCADAVIR